MLVKNQNSKLRTHGFLLSLCLPAFLYSLFFVNIVGAIAADQPNDLNENLKNVIEQNQRLIAEKNELTSEVNRLKSINTETKARLGDLERDRDALQSTMQNVRSENRKYAKEVKKLQESIDELENAKDEYGRITKRLEEELLIQQGWQNSEDTDIASSKNEDVIVHESKTLDLLSKIDAFAEKDEKLRSDSAKAHYNMGNIYFQKGEYELAFREYYQAVTLMPSDPDAHYNLAFVSGEYLNDHKTALKHYQIYLYLKPDAKDANIVKEKIIQSRLFLKSIIDSPLDKKK